MGTSHPAPFSDVAVTLGGEDFSLTNYFLHDSFWFSHPSTPHPAWVLHHHGDPVEFSGWVDLVSPLDLLVFDGVSYQVSGRIDVTTFPAIVFVDSLVTQPFTLSGTIHGESLTGPETIDLDIGGSGVVTARYTRLPGDDYWLASISYDVAPIPEPTTLVLLASGLVGLGVRRSRRRTI